ncbi:hypothetical protein FF80_01654 [Devosia sp. LC5]|uniref:hypothetical protein n=1 Tax=Devosia sp. LC5 TaxID=1502724 RepID=UPI0004E2C423|nr:hypothetical protein [Devosia sp. LC5]KFC68701.1 hypothetical protein FF80_01654 [Devosia sp. LC5]
MIGWILKKLTRNQPAPKNEPPRSVPGENCALWHDVSRALDQSASARKAKGATR